MIGNGLKFEYNSTGVIFVEVDGVVAVEFSGSKVDTIDNSDVKTVKVRTFEAGLEDPGECTIKGRYIPANASQVALLGQKDGVKHDYKVTYPGTVATETFSGFLTSFDRSFPNDKEVEFTAKIKISGPVVIA